MVSPLETLQAFQQIPGMLPSARELDERLQNIAVQQAELGLQKGRQQLQAGAGAAEMQRAQVAGLLGKALVDVPIEQRRPILESFSNILGPFEEGDDSDENINQAVQIFENLFPVVEKPQLGRFDAKVVGNTLVTTDSITGEQRIEKFGSTAPVPPGLDPKMEQAWQSLGPKVQTELWKKQLDPKTIADNEKKAKQVAKSENVRKITVDLIGRIRRNKELKNVLGAVEGLFDFRLDPDEVELIADIRELENLLTVENLDLMTGVLSETDIAILRSVGAGGLDRRRSVDEFKRRLDNIEAGFTGRGAEVQALPADEPVQTRGSGRNATRSRKEQLKRELGL